ncbi:sirohydrochlorin chelatase [Actinoplanes sp. HUAS TT8]|uniref:sirohydrochlorin chelatase n=1 Tax=Actinoplanes sp. HUAS TT8 TaxID=3447453 RepID=UPI003F51B29D
MRSARVRSAPPAVILVAHGSQDPRAAESTEALARAVRRNRPEWLVRAAYLDHAGPRPLDVLGELGARRAVLVPLLLTEAYHGRVDLPAVVAGAAELAVSVALADVLGPKRGEPGHGGGASGLPGSAPAMPGLASAGAGLTSAMPGLTAAGLGLASGGSGLASAGSGRGGLERGGPGRVPRLLLDALIRRLPVDGFDGVVLAAAGTRDPVARETVEHAAAALGARLGMPAAVSYSSGVGPRAGEAVEALRDRGVRRVAVAGYFLAPGLLYDLAVTSARDAGAVAVAEPLGDAPEIVRLISARVAATGIRVLAAA